MTPASGTQTILRAGGYGAVIASVGATLRALTFEGRDLIIPFGAEQMRPEMRGALLAPWPNRTADGRYDFDGHTHQLPINEVGTRNASHGLVSWQDFDVYAPSADSVALTTTLQPQPGYPWRLRIESRFSLGDDGLTQEVSATNLSESPAPFGVGGHPYLVAGESFRSAVDDWQLEVPATRVCLITQDRMLPIGVVDVGSPAGDGFDFRTLRRIGSRELNNAYTGLTRNGGAGARVRVTGVSGQGVEIILSEDCKWVQVYTADGSPGASYRAAVAVEPMTCPPDAMNSKCDLMVLAPGKTKRASWTIRAVRSDRQLNAPYGGRMREPGGLPVGAAGRVPPATAAPALPARSCRRSWREPSSSAPDRLTRY